MKLAQFKYRQNTGVATVFTAETEEEMNMLEVLRELIEDEKGALSRKCFTFDQESDSMSIDMEKYTATSRRYKTKKAEDAAAAETTTPKRRGAAKADK